MDPLLLKYYNRELQYIRQMGVEFAREFPKIASRLNLDEFQCADPYVERLLEGFAFLAARVQLKIDARYPVFCQHLLEIIYPHYLVPMPSMAIVQFVPDSGVPALTEGFLIPRHSSLRNLLGKGEQTACEYRTAHDVTLWPLEVAHAEYTDNPASFSSSSESFLEQKPHAALCLKFRGIGTDINQLTLDRLPLYLSSNNEQAMRLYEQLVGNTLCVVARDGNKNVIRTLPADSVRPLGFDDSASMLPEQSASFSGYRILQEYFAFPQRYLFIEFSDLKSVVLHCTGNVFELCVLFRRFDSELLNNVNRNDFALYCTPIVNLFEKRLDRIHLTDKKTEYHIVPDRTRPLDFEIYQITSITGHGNTAEDEQVFLPFYSSRDIHGYRGHQAFYTIRRERRQLSSKQRRLGSRSTYIGSEVFLSLVDAREAPYSGNLKQISVRAICTNRDLPLMMQITQDSSNFTLDSSAPVNRIHCLAGPTPPKPSLAHAQEEISWRLINHLSLNYMSLVDADEGRGAAALRELLRIYANLDDAATRKQIEGIKSVQSRRVTRRLPGSGPIAFGKGLEIKILFEDEAFHGMSAFLLGAVLERFLSRYASINSFTETIVCTVERGEIMRWPVRNGLRATL